MTEEATHNKNRKEGPEKSGSAIPWIAASILVVGLAVLAGLYWSKTTTVRALSFEGTHFVEKETLKSSVRVPMGVNPDSLDFMAIINQAEKIPYVKKADVNVEPGGNLRIDITERQPVALLSDGDQKRYIDIDGVVLPIVLGKAVDVPILYGFRIGESDTLQGDKFLAVQEFLQALEKRTVSDATISEIAWTREEGVVALTTENGVKLLFGKENFDTKLRNWEAFFGQVIKTKGIHAMRQVDLRFRGQIVTQEG